MSHTTHQLSFVPFPQPEGYRYYNIQSDTDRQLLASRCKERLQALHLIPVEEREQYHRALQELLGGLGEGSWLVTPFFCDYGSEVEVGSHTFINSGCTMLDGGHVTIGDHVLIGPSVSLYSVGHPLDLEERAAGWEFGIPIIIEDHVWIGGGCTILPGVTIGRGSVIGAGSVVTKSIPPMSLAVGNPCRVIRSLSKPTESLD